MIRIRWLDPKKEKASEGTYGEIRGHSVVLYEGRADELTEAHERAHIALGHYKREDDITPERYWEREVDANLYTYRKMGRPRRLIMQLRGHLFLFVDEWGLPKVKALRILERGLKVRGVPRGWVRDWERLRDEVDGRRN